MKHIKKFLFQLGIFILAIFLGFLITEFIPDLLSGILIGFILCLKLHEKKIEKFTCQPEKNIHIFSNGSKVCDCSRTMEDGTIFSIPLVAQRKFS